LREPELLRAGALRELALFAGASRFAAGLLVCAAGFLVELAALRGDLVVELGVTRGALGMVTSSVKSGSWSLGRENGRGPGL
jgi:hypothetical protein